MPPARPTPATSSNSARAAPSFSPVPPSCTILGTRNDLERGGEDLFEVLGQGVVQPAANYVYPLSEAAEAHRALEARETTGTNRVPALGVRE